MRECKSKCEKPTIGIRALRSTYGDAAEDRGGKLVINWRSAEIRESGDKLYFHITGYLISLGNANGSLLRGAWFVGSDWRG